MVQNFTHNPKTTEYIFEPLGQDLKVAICIDGSKIPSMWDYCSETRLLDVLDYLKTQGYVCRIHRDGKGQAIKGKPTRIDIIKDGENFICKKYPQGWIASTPPIETKTLTQEQADEAVKWLREHNWKIRESLSDNGSTIVRAWLGELLPIRDRRTILLVHKQIEDNKWRNIPDPRAPFDLAFDC